MQNVTMVCNRNFKMLNILSPPFISGVYEISYDFHVILLFLLNENSHCECSVASTQLPLDIARDWSLITGTGVYKRENRGSETLCTPPLEREGETFRAPFQYGLKFKLLHKNYPKTFRSSPSAWLKQSPPPYFHKGKTSHPPPSCFVAPLPVISDPKHMVCFVFHGSKTTTPEITTPKTTTLGTTTLGATTP